MNHLLGILLALGAALIWAIVPSLYALGMRDTLPILANAIRLFIGGLFSVIFAIFTENFIKNLPFDPIQVGFLVIITLIGTGFGDWLYFRLLESTDVTFVVGICNIHPLFVALLAIIFKFERLTQMTLLASIVITIGVIFVNTSRNSIKNQTFFRNITQAMIFFLGNLILSELKQTYFILTDTAFHLEIFTDSSFDFSHDIQQIERIKLLPVFFIIEGMVERETRRFMHKQRCRASKPHGFYYTGIF